ncbi:MAG TPA: DUF4261 domain-containing protein [Planctomycetes bacterium]|nr:DUF4261 domain-containing protein [Planctomycetota bacterium]
MISIIALESAIEPQDHEIGDLIRGLLGKDTIVRLTDAGRTTVAEVVDVVVKVSRRNHPIPADLVEGPLSEAWYWPDAEEVLAQHESHLIVMVEDARTETVEASNEQESTITKEAEDDSTGSRSLSGENNPPPLDAKKIRFSVQSALLLTRVSQVIGSALGAVGVYWDASTTIHSWSAFNDSCEQMSSDNLPIRIWVDFRLWEAPDGTRGLVTRGLSTLGQRELEVIGSSSTAEQIRAWCYTVAHYCLEQCEILVHGQAVGISPKEWIRAWVVESRLDPGHWTTWLDLEAEE